ncbi:efflux RND transporter periplasmic adaptor subunit [Pseudodonghicola flavimaris]|uniref:Efflux RND transporter periplasmic adaptor subunit n=1 Tax=Pseudodonghicola flavimaris TaxID=3050036 RepID=A0ABT7F3R7_9RHOB|nr:efflux RND transporter periplasmic adaptor subunit [Pseudodonghicola flavimaris]MDK3019255.1 efflux RND transporter periplasmic adaptor subunit [Pseudodonghicola flavimaris]
MMISQRFKRFGQGRWPLALTLLLGLTGPDLASAQTMPGAAGPTAVGVVTMQKQAVPRSYTLPGRAVAYEQVDIRPRVDGVVQEILYTPGATLSVGDPLFKLDDASYRATVAGDEAELASAQASLTLAQTSYDRAQRLKGSGYTVAEVEAARATLAEAQAAVDAARAALDFARTQLSWTTIRSPIQGVAEVADVSVGALVTSGQSDALTTVTRLDPIEVDMLEASARVLSIRNQIDSGTMTLADKLDATLTLENGQIYQGSGTLVAPGSTVATTTGTISIRFRFENPDHLILPGMFLRGEVTLGTIQAYLVPQRAGSHDSAGNLVVFAADAGGTARQLALKDIGSWQNSWVVTEGLSDGDRIIVDGLKSLRAGAEVTATEVEITGTGLVRDAPTSTQD